MSGKKFRGRETLVIDVRECGKDLETGVTSEDLSGRVLKAVRSLERNGEIDMRVISSTRLEFARSYYRADCSALVRVTRSTRCDTSYSKP